MAEHASFRRTKSRPSFPGLGVSGVRYWRLLGLKIALLAAHMGVLMSMVVTPLMLWFMAGGLGGYGLAFVGGFLLIGIPLGWVSGFVMNGVIALVILPLVAGSIRLFGVQPRRDTVGKIAGSSVALAGSVGGLTDPFAGAAAMPGGSAVFWFTTVWVVVSLCLGVAACQAGGCLASLNDLRRRHRGRLPKTVAPRLTIWALMAITAVVSLVLGLLRLAGLLTSPLVIGLLVATAVAYAIHGPVAWATNRWLNWRLAKRREKRAASHLTPPPNLAAPSSS